MVLVPLFIPRTWICFSSMVRICTGKTVWSQVPWRKTPKLMNPMQLDIPL